MKQSGLTLATNNEKGSEQYIYYPDMTKEEAERFVRTTNDKRFDDRTLPRANMYALWGDIHKPDFLNWKDALENKRKIFSHTGFIFYEENIKRLEPKGYIICLTTR